MAPRIILIHGASSAGKSTLARALQSRAPEPFWRYSFDTLRDGGVLPLSHPGFVWAERRARVFDGLHRSILAFAAAGNDLILEMILDAPGAQEDLRRLLAKTDLFFVALHLPLDELKQRARRRPERPDLTDQDFALMQRPLGYDLELDGREDPLLNADRLLEAWTRRRAVSGFFGGVDA